MMKNKRLANHVLVQSRMTSTRFPGKVLADLCGKPMLLRLMDRLGSSRLVEQAVVCTSDEESDDPIVALCEKQGIPYFRGSLSDVLDRYYQCAKKFQSKTIVRVTGDCPLIDPGLLDDCVESFEKSDVDYLCNRRPPTFPDGLDLEVFSFEGLERCWVEAKLGSEREHVTPYFYSGDHGFRLKSLLSDEDLSCHRWTVDYPRDLEFVREVFSCFSEEQRSSFSYREVLECLERKPELLKLNGGVQRDEGYIASLKKEKSLSSRGLKS